MEMKARVSKAAANVKQAIKKANEKPDRFNIRQYGISVNKRGCVQFRRKV